MIIKRLRENIKHIPTQKRLFLLWTLAMDMKFLDLSEILNEQPELLPELAATTTNPNAQRMLY